MNLLLLFAVTMIASAWISIPIILYRASMEKKEEVQELETEKKKRKLGMKGFKKRRKRR